VESVLKTLVSVSKWEAVRSNLGQVLGGEWAVGSNELREVDSCRCDLCRENTFLAT
jgi:hypothetical protein